MESLGIGLDKSFEKCMEDFVHVGLAINILIVVIKANSSVDS